MVHTVSSCVTVSDVLLALFLSAWVCHVPLYIYVHSKQLSLCLPYNPVDIYQLETIIREQLRKACLPSYQDTLTQCTTELHITNAKVLTTTSQLQRTVPLRRNKLRFFLSTFLRMSDCPNRKLCGYGLQLPDLTEQALNN